MGEKWEAHQKDLAEAAKLKATNTGESKKKWDDAYALARGDAQKMIDDLVAQYGSIAAVKAHLQQEQEQREAAEAAEASGDTEDAGSQAEPAPSSPPPPPSPTPAPAEEDPA